MITTETRQRDFPSLARMAYLNTAADGIPPTCVKTALDEYWADKCKGMDGRAAHLAKEESCREVAARFLKLTPSEVGFCSCSSEAYNLLASALQLKSTDEVVINDLDFPSGATPWRIAPPLPTVRLWRSRGGELCTDDLEPLLSHRTRLVQVSLVSFYNGFRIPWEPLVRCVRACAPQAVLAVDATQALGRVPWDAVEADFVVCSTHKWVLGFHGGCIVGVSKRRGAELTTKVGGWHHLNRAFEPDRFERTEVVPGAASYAVGMPSFAPLYALNASLHYVEQIGVEQIAAHANRLTQRLSDELVEIGLRPLTLFNPRCPSGILAFTHPHAEVICQRLHEEGVHALYHTGRLRFAVHGYNIDEDIDRCLSVLRALPVDWRHLNSR